MLHPGTFSVLVDRGRPTTRSLGVPFGGAADVAAFQIGNALVGNTHNAIALEINLSGPTLRAESDVSCCVFGAPFTINAGGRSIPAGTAFTIRSGDLLKIGGASRGARGYLCVKGGFAAPRILESGSAFDPIAEGQRLTCDPSSGHGRSLEHSDVDSLLGGPPDVLRVLDGAQADWFPTHDFCRRPFTVTPAGSRMGIRLRGAAVARRPGELISEAVAPGAIQITNEGQPIVLGVDGQTIGGYPKIAHVIAADLDRVGQLRAGQTVRFERIKMDEAEAIAADRRRKLHRWLAALRIFAQP